jgi:hypothetical protein
MNLFTVVWTSSAQNLLAERWLAAVGRRAVTKAVATIDAALAHDPAEKGEHLSEGLRQFVSPRSPSYSPSTTPTALSRLQSVKMFLSEPPA